MKGNKFYSVSCHAGKAGDEAWGLKPKASQTAFRFLCRLQVRSAAAWASGRLLHTVKRGSRRRETKRLFKDKGNVRIPRVNTSCDLSTVLMS